MTGYREMLRQIEPEHIICYSEPFKEMTGNIIYVDYDLSSWKHMEDDAVKSCCVKHIIGYTENYQSSPRIVRKIGYVFKGGGSAYGGEWMPKDANAERFLGKPNSIERHFVSNKSGDGGYYADLKYDENGHAISEREYTDHGKPHTHTNPHDHVIDWSNGAPKPSSPIKLDGDVIPEFKKNILGDIIMKNNNSNGSAYDFSFESLAELKFCISCGAEITFDYNGHLYGIGKITETEYYIGSCSQNGEPEPGDDLYSSDIEEILDYPIDGKKLRERLDDIDIIERTL